LEGSPTLLSLVLEVRVQAIVYHEALVDCKLTGHAHQITYLLVKVAELGDFSLLHDYLLEIVKFSA
jgi:hypothetical protein